MSELTINQPDLNSLITLARQPATVAADNFQRYLAHQPSQDSLAKAAREFEAGFLSQFLEIMFAGIEVDGMFGGGHSEAIFRSMLMEQYAKIISENNEGVGIAKQICNLYGRHGKPRIH